ALGGSGGSGGSGGGVVLNIDSAISTSGARSAALVAQSVGGGGGVAGSSSSNASSGAHAVSLALGATGGSGGKGGSVQVDLNTGAHLQTGGVLSHGVLAQSIGGGGGLGGSSSSTSADAGNSNVSLALGGKAGSGQNGGSVQVRSQGSISTGGFGADGVLAQSIGGGGGSGGAAASSTSGGQMAANVALGGSGGGAGDGNTVAVTYQAAISTQGEQARAVLAQSIGGGGGSGGNSTTTSGGAGTKTASLALGGAAGSSGGGSGGAVSVDSPAAAAVSTAGHFASALVAQSIGGGGGTGGSSYGSSDGSSDSYTLGLNLGGAGGRGGSGGSVSVALLASGGSLRTGGVAAFGVLAQSVGGGGGLGGAASWVSGGGDNSVSVSGQLGGKGGDGGSGGAVRVLLNQNLSTSGALAPGVLAQSVGGGGGVGAAATSTLYGGDFSGSVALGRSGGNGSGGSGGAVTFGLDGSLGTAGALSHGAVAQSIGGGGGLNLTRAFSTTLGGSYGAAAGTVWLQSQAALSTSGDGATGLVAQSIGGGGGLSTALWDSTLGGAPSGSHGGLVQLCQAHDAAGNCAGNSWMGGSISTQGTFGIGVLAQSIGGGGGAVISPYNGLQTTLKGGGGHSDFVTVWAGQNISTSGNGAMGLVAQGIGGGGGFTGGHYYVTGSYGHTLATAASGDQAYGASVAVWANSGTQSLSTTGMNATALLAQSIGGGGGAFTNTNVTHASEMGLKVALGSNGGNSDSNSTTVALGTRRIGTTGAGSLGVLAQSVGGGGGYFSWVAPTSSGAGGASSTNATLNAQLGQARDGGRANDVSLSGAPVLTTQGLHAAGLVAQTVGNGGGTVLAAGREGQVFSGTVNLGSTGGKDWGSGTLNVNIDGGSLATRGDMAPALVAQSVAGGGGLALALTSNTHLGGTSVKSDYNRAGPVTVNNSAAISTTGAGSVGIVAQSIGGGGGLAYASSGAQLGGTAGDGGHGAAVLVNSNAPISTSGVNAFGILAQSVGGGGGAVLGTGGALSTTQRGRHGDASDVTVNVNAPITTSGAGAHGVVAQSVRGGGGIVTNGSSTTGYGGGNGTGNAGVVKVTLAKGVNITVTGAGAYGLWAWSSTDPILEVAPGASVQGGSGAAAIRFDGPINEVHNDGQIGSADGHAGLAVHTTGGDILINNRGLMQGNLQLADGANNRVHNQAGGRLVHGGTLDLGGSGTLRNDGSLAHGGSAGAATRIDGHFEQGAEGTLHLRLDHAGGAMDTLEVSGRATLQGALRPQLVDAHKVAPGTRELGAIVSAGQGVDASALTLEDTAILDFRLHPQDGALAFSAHADFSPEGMNEDVQRLGDVLGTAQGDERENFRALTARLVALRSPQELHQAYWELSGAGATTVATVGARQGTVFARLLTDRVGAQPDALPAGQAGHAAWVQALGERHGARYSGAGTANVEARLGGLAAGTDTRLDARTTVGVALASAQSKLRMSHGYSASGRAVQLGVYGARELGSGAAAPGTGPAGGTYVAAALSYARHQADTERLFELTGAQYRARLDGYALGLRGEYGWRMALPGWGLAPYGALQVQHHVTRAHQEAASLQAHLALNYGRGAYTQLRSELGAAADGRIALRGGEVLSLRGRLAWAHEAWSEHRQHAAFQTLHSQPFSVVGVTPVSDLAVLSALAELRLSARLAVELNLQGEYGRRTQTRAAAAALRYRW
ncbi:hypothetical protein IP87_00485, partial [beta proteobacterium AAP121]